jgi:hypothetical protein
MIRTILSLVTAALALAAASCCCTSDTEAPPLRPLPKFLEMPAADSYAVEATK